MLNCRHLRIKILHVLFGYYQDEDRDVKRARQALDHSTQKMQELYLMLLDMIGSMQALAIDRIEAGYKKQLPSPEDLNLNTKFVTNKLCASLPTARTPWKACDELGVGWGNRQELLRAIFRGLLENEEYQDKHMASEERGFQMDRESLVRMFRQAWSTSRCSRTCSKKKAFIGWMTSIWPQAWSSRPSRRSRRATKK